MVILGLTGRSSARTGIKPTLYLFGEDIRDERYKEASVKVIEAAVREQQPWMVCQQLSDKFRCAIVAHYCLCTSGHPRGRCSCES